ncbi:MAG: carboxypeptidase-like regulatory domain-containing protein, partial [Flavobacteriaceae bacterium]
MRGIFFIILSLSFFTLQGQTKIGGMVVDEQGEAVSFANVFFKNSTEGTITNDDGRFYLESENDYNTVIISFIGYTEYEL